MSTTLQAEQRVHIVALRTLAVLLSVAAVHP